MAGGTPGHGAAEGGEVCILGSGGGKGGTEFDDEANLMIGLAECAEDDRMDAAGLEAGLEGFGEMMGAIVVSTGDVKLLGPALVVAAHGCELAVGGSAVLCGSNSVVHKLYVYDMYVRTM